MDIYIKVFYAFALLIGIIMLRRRYIQLFVKENESFSFKKYKSYDRFRKNFVYSVVSFCFGMTILAVYLFMTPKSNSEIIKTESIEIEVPDIKEKTIEELEAESDAEKSEYYKMMHPERFNTDSILEVEYKKSEEKFGGN
jgi:hypothetical protein